MVDVSPQNSTPPTVTIPVLPIETRQKIAEEYLAEPTEGDARRRLTSYELRVSAERDEAVQRLAQADENATSALREMLAERVRTTHIMVALAEAQTTLRRFWIFVAVVGASPWVAMWVLR